MPRRRVREATRAFPRSHSRERVRRVGGCAPRRVLPVDQLPLGIVGELGAARVAIPTRGGGRRAGGAAGHLAVAVVERRVGRRGDAYVCGGV